MSSEQQLGRERAIEQLLVRMSQFAFSSLKLVVLTGALKFAELGGTIKEKPLGIPAQLLPTHDALTQEILEVEQNPGELILSRCALAFKVAAINQINSSDRNYILTGSDYEYVAIVGSNSRKLFLHRPTVATESSAPYPYWLEEEVVSNDASTDLPVLHSLKYPVDELGNLQAEEYLCNGQKILRPLHPHEVQPFVDVINTLKIHPMVPSTESLKTQ